MRGLPGEYVFSYGPVETNPITFAPGDPIFGPKTSETLVWLLLSGTARLIRTEGRDFGKSSVLIYPGELVGLTETLAAVPHSAILEAVSPCLLQRMDIDDLLKWLKWKPEAGLEILRTVGAFLTEAHSHSMRVLMCDHYHRRKVNQDLGLK